METQTESTDPLLDVVAFGNKVGKAPVTIGRWLKEGRLPVPIRIANKRYWRGSVIDAWLDDLQNRAEDEAA